MSIFSFRVEIHHIGALVAFERFETELGSLFSGDQINPFDPKFAGNKVALFSDPLLAQAAKAVLGNGISTFADLGIGSALHRGGHKAFNNFQINAIDLILDNPELSEAQQKAALWDLHRFSSDLAKNGSVPTADGGGSIPLAYPAGTVDQAIHEQELTAAWEAQRGPLSELTTNSTLVNARNEYESNFNRNITDPEHKSNDANTGNVEARRDLAIDLVTAAKNLVGQPDWVVDRYSDLLNALTNPDFNANAGSADSKRVSGAITSALLDITKAMGVRDSNGTIRSPLDPNFLVSNQGYLVDKASASNLFVNKIFEFGANSDGSISLDVAQLGINKIFNGIESIFANSNFNVREFFSSTTNLVALGGGFIGDAAEFIDASYESIKKGFQTGDWSDFGDNVAQFGVGLVISAALIASTTAIAASVSPLLGALVGATWAAKGIYDGWVAISSLINKISDDLFTDGGWAADLFGPGGVFEGQFSTIESLVDLNQLITYTQNVLDISNLVQELASIFISAAALDPLTIDLDGDGVNTIPVDQSNAFFDLDNNGVAEQVGWIEPEDGFVVHDWNGDGIINNRSEQFAEFLELARHDTNGDGIISAADTAATLQDDLDGDDILETVTVGFDSLRIWIDANSDGITDAGELHTLGDLGIVSIDLNATPLQQDNNGNELNAVSTVALSDGSTQDIFGISFDRNTANTDFQARIDALDLSPEYLASRLDAFVLPSLAGGGNVPTLLIASLESDAVLDTLRAASQIQLTDTADYMLRVQQLIVDWAGVGDVDPGSRPGIADARHLAAMEAFVGVDFDGSNIAAPRAAALEEGWDAFVAGIGLRIAIQAEQDFNPGGLVTYDPTQDSFSGDFAALLDHLSNAIIDNAATSSLDNEGLISMVRSLHESVADQIDSTVAAAFEAFYTNVLTVTPASIAADFFAASGYYDPTRNFDLDPDYEHPSAVVAVIPNGDGFTIFLGDVDTDFHDYEIGKEDNDEKFYLTDHDAGVQLSALTEYSASSELNGQAYYGYGDDYYSGGEGSDTYVLNKTVGFDTIDETGLGQSNPEDEDRLFIAETEAETTLSRDGDDLFISWAGSGYIVRVVDQFASSGVIEGITFEAPLIVGHTHETGFQYDAAWIEANAWYRGGDGRDAIVGTSGNETFFGAGGDDIIDMGSGTNTLVYDSGDGNDVIQGGSATLKLRDLAASQVFLFVREDILHVENTLTGHILTIEEQFTGGGLAAIEFSDGETWDRGEIESRAVVLGTEFDDILSGSSRGEIYWGRTGDDVMRGGNGGDTYLYALGDGADFIGEGNLDGGTDVLRFTDLNLSDVRLTREAAGNWTLYIKVKVTGDTIIVSDQFSPTGFGGLESIEFADGTAIDELGMEQNLHLLGTDQSEILYGSASGELIEGGLGDDFLEGHDGGDIYLYRAGDGSDRITESWTFGGTDVLDLRDLTLADVYLTRGSGNNYDLTVTVRATGEVITVESHFLGLSSTGIEQIDFADGSSLDEAGIEANLSLIGTDQDDSLDGSVLGEQIIGGAGDDTLVGEYGGDVYVYASGDGNDRIIEETFGSGTDVLKLTDLNQADILFSREVGQSDLMITIGATGEQIVVQSQFLSGDYSEGLERIEFADGTFLERQALETGTLVQMLATGDSGDNSLNGTEGDDWITGNLGNDSLNGGTGSDIYFYTSGDGSDLIDENDVSMAATDVLAFTDINAADITTGKSGSDFLITVTATGETITIDDQFLSAGDYSGIEEIRFADDTVWDRNRILEEIAIRGTEGADTANGTSSNDVIVAGAGDDSVFGLGGEDLIFGDTGDDTLEGGGGSDTYVFNRGDGADEIHDNGWYDTDRVEIRGYAVAEVIASRGVSDGKDLVLTFAGTSDVLTLRNTLGGDKWDTIEQIAFDDGTVWTMDDVADLIRAGFATAGDDTISDFDLAGSLDGGTGNDLIFGNKGEDTLIGGAGNDTLEGGGNSDTYVFSQGDGEDEIHDNGWYDTDRLEIRGYTPDDVILDFGPESADDLLITFAGSSDRIVVRNTLDGDKWDTLEQIAFDDGTVWTTADVIAMLTAGSDVTHQGGAGNDFLTGSSGADTIDGALGNDTLFGEEGSDLYLYASGDGNDFLDDEVNSASDVDVLRLTDLNVADVVGTRVDTDFVLTVLATGETITMDSQFWSPTQYWGVEQIEFADGTTWDRQQIWSEGIYRGGTGADSMSGIEPR